MCSHLVCSHLVCSHLVCSHLVCSYLVCSHLVCNHLVLLTAVIIVCSCVGVDTQYPYQPFLPSRINVGGAHVAGYMQRLLQLKYPALLGHITLSRAQEITSSHCYVALNYSAELVAACAMGDEGFRVIQLPYTQVRACGVCQFQMMCLC